MGRWLQELEYLAVVGLLWLTKALPRWVLRPAAAVFGGGAFRLLSRRRRIAIDNIVHAFGDRLSAGEARRIARASFVSFDLTSMPDAVKLRSALT